METKNKIKVAIIGAGRMGITHYSIINSHPDVLIDSVAEPSGIVSGMINKYLPVKTFDDYNELFEKQGRCHSCLYSSKFTLCNNPKSL